ncbi:MAG: 4Fe-4S dicluster domain-containing protein [Acidimicrobiia bacterium]|nr:4Fe-4S dicluster domain-containing protein [Acidimicrobiia bacterium]
MYVSGQSGVGRLIQALAERGHRVIGPIVRNEALVYDEIKGVEDLPKGWTDLQEPGRYRLEQRGDEKLFGFVVGPTSWKQYLNPPETVLWSGVISPEGFVTDPAPEPPKYAFFGVRPCEVAALGVLDKVYSTSNGLPSMAGYTAIREQAFIVAVNCVEPGGNCFCVSMDTGPTAEAGYDIAITEIVHNGNMRYLIEAGTPAGAEVLGDMGNLEEPSEAEIEARDFFLTEAAANMGKTLEVDDLPELLKGNARNPRWESIADRCLACANCTMVCPTCFCNTVDDNLSLDGTHATRTRKWDSCFTLGFSYMHGLPMREGVGARYRQWITHKLATWVDQFDEMGCVGCGRCITWCPVGIDITHEAGAIRRADLRDTPIGIGGFA